MRAVMAVLRAAGNLKRRYSGKGVDPKIYSEPVLMLRAITDVNLPKVRMKERKKERKTYARCQACVMGALASKSHRRPKVSCWMAGWAVQLCSLSV
jgi:hypothetical protein